MPKIEISKFGEVNYKNSDIIAFVNPLLGFSNLTQYFIISRPESEPFKWLQSIEDPSISIVILDPLLVYPEYIIDISPHDIRRLDGTENLDDYQVYGIVSVPNGRPDQMSINLQGPIVINVKNLKALQLVLNNPDYDIRYSLFKNKQPA